ncbi:hypothetical protein V6N11_032004 [Hibiscus sabdariffa]|uniref:Solute-binding protein family 3/N-terminal domain-containing protein n=1 Tax=Hibiscus sabdariffa TaxID=183260 RepID=A0ABR2SZC1_9ROSI
MREKPEGDSRWRSDGYGKVMELENEREQSVVWKEVMFFNGINEGEISGKGRVRGGTGGGQGRRVRAREVEGLLSGGMAGNYDDLILGVYHKNFDAVVGDITIIASRFPFVDFTLPFTDMGMGVVVPKTNKNDIWIFLKPLSGDLWITTVFAHQEKLLSNLSKFVVTATTGGFGFVFPKGVLTKLSGDFRSLYSYKLQKNVIQRKCCGRIDDREKKGVHQFQFLLSALYGKNLNCHSGKLLATSALCLFPCFISSLPVQASPKDWDIP